MQRSELANTILYEIKKDSPTCSSSGSKKTRDFFVPHNVRSKRSLKNSNTQTLNSPNMKSTKPTKKKKANKNNMALQVNDIQQQEIVEEEKTNTSSTIRSVYPLNLVILGIGTNLVPATRLAMRRKKTQMMADESIWTCISDLEKTDVRSESSSCVSHSSGGSSSALTLTGVDESFLSQSFSEAALSPNNTPSSSDITSGSESECESCSSYHDYNEDYDGDVAGADVD